MEERVLVKNKNGMLMLLLFAALYLAALALIVVSAVLENFVLLAVGIVYLCLGWIFFCGLKVLKPQEALVLTLFGK